MAVRLSWSCWPAGVGQGWPVVGRPGSRSCWLAGVGRGWPVARWSVWLFVAEHCSVASQEPVCRGGLPGQPSSGMWLSFDDQVKVVDAVVVE